MTLEYLWIFYRGLIHSGLSRLGPRNSHSDPGVFQEPDGCYPELSSGASIRKGGRSHCGRTADAVIHGSGTAIFRAPDDVTLAFVDCEV
ncbi:MAG: hypothetical protein WCR04_12375 [Fibrobacteraceae bacterium]